MNKIVISGYYGFGNAGDEAMLAAILEAILEVMPEANITVISGNPKHTAAKHGVSAIGRFEGFKIFKALSQCDLLISGGGSLLQDVTSNRSLYYYLSIISLATFFNKPVMLYAQGIGPLRKKLAQRAVGATLRKVTLITVRDEKSKAELQRLGVTNVPIEVTADAVLSMHPVDTSIGRRLLKEYTLSGVKPRIGVSVRKWKQSTTYRQELALALDELQEAYEADIVFIPMQYPDDMEEGQEIAQLMTKKSTVLKQVYTTTELLALYGCMDLIIGVRLHALVFGALMEKPVVGITYDPKITNFLSMIGKHPVGSLTELKAKPLVDECKQLLAEPSYNEKSLQLIVELREESLKNAYMALSLLKSK